MSKPNLTLEEREQVYKHVLTHTVKETAKHFGISDSTVYNIRARFNTEPTPEAPEALEPAMKQDPEQANVGIEQELNKLREELEIRTVLTDQLMQTLTKNTELREELEYSKQIIRKLVE